MLGLISRFLNPVPPEARECASGEFLLRMPRNQDYAAWADLRAKSRAFLQPWEPRWPEDDLTPAAYRQRMARLRREIAADQTYPFFLFAQAGTTVAEGHATDQLLGGLTLSNIRRRAAMTGTLGYWMGAPYAGKGLMSRAIPMLCNHAFRHLALERIEAACLPENLASIRVLEKSGFRREGFARQYLSIAGARRDHLLFAILRTDLGSA